MRITIASGGRRRAVDVIATPRAVLADLVAAADAPRTDHVHVDGRRVDTDHGLAEAGLADGAVVELGPVDGPHGASGPSRPVAAAATEEERSPRLVVLTGTDAGTVVPLDAPVLVGSGPDVDVRVRARGLAPAHVRFELAGDAVRITPLGVVSSDGVALAGATIVPIGAVLRCGAAVLQVVGPAPSDRPTGPRAGVAGTPFNRPPRPAGTPTADAVVLPAPPGAVAAAQPFPWLAALLPLVLAAVLVATTGSWRFAVFLLLGPVLLAGNWWTQRRRGRRDGTTQASDRTAALDRLRRDCAVAVAQERRRRWAAHADMAELARRARGPSVRLWERRTTDHDALCLVTGVGDVEHDLEIDPRSPAPDEDVRAVLRDASRLVAVPVEVDLRGGGVVGIVGAPDAGRGLARALVLQTLVHHGPADIELTVVAASRRVGDWWWTAWAPHARDGEARRLAVAGRPGTDLLAGLLDGRLADERRTRLVVVDAVEQLQGRGAPARAVLAGDAGPVAGVVVADRLDQLPAVCTTVVRVDDDDHARIVRGAAAGQAFAPVGCTAEAAAQAARGLARHDDPEAGGGAGRLPRAVGLPDLLGPGWDDPTVVAGRWVASGAAGDVLDVPLGVGADGTVTVDLVADGPHGLLGGTTGSGKSELLRTLVAGLAARHGPERCTFLLVDYKGGAAFDACADLPHVVGLVTDLDEHLAGRALASLDAELRHREGRLRAAGVTDLAQWQRLPVTSRGEPLPRLVVVVDEFATLKAELPGFVDALVGVAQRGRSLGVHLLLGTQRPAGAVSDDVRANSALRVALRVTDARDAVDVVGTADAAHIPHDLPGRGLLRRGPAAPSALQTALATGRSAARPPVVLRPVRLDAGPGAGDEAVDGDGPTDLERLVTACHDAASGAVSPRAPWLPPLPEHLAMTDLGDPVGAKDDGPLAVGLLDVPEEQQQVPAGWDPAAGTLLVHGTVGSGTTTTLTAVVLAAARRWSPDDCHVQVLDLGRGQLAPLVGLPHVGSVVTAREEERRARLLTELVAEGDRRRRLDAVELDDEPLLLVAIDHLDALLDELDTGGAYDVEAALLRLLADAPGLRIAVAATTGRPGGLRPGVVATAADRWAHRLADRADLGLLGVRADAVPDLVPGRCVRASDGRLLQVAEPGDVTSAVARLDGRWPAPGRAPHVVRVLPAHVPVEVVDGRAELRDDTWSLVVGLGDRDLAPAGPVLLRGQHAVVLGPPGSGRSAALTAIAASVPGPGVAGTGPVALTVAGTARSPLHGSGLGREVAPDELGAVLRALVAGDRDAVVLVDDADRVPDPGPVLQDLADDGARVHLVVAARTDAVQADYGHWVRRLARARVGVVLGPPDGGGFELLSARAPRAAGRRLPGRGWLVGHDVEPVQVAAPAIHRASDRTRTSGRRSA